jgi:hypothetical protein
VAEGSRAVNSDGGIFTNSDAGKAQILGITGEKQLPVADRLVMNKDVADDKVALKTALHTIRPASGMRSMT